jgi:hypothetical protein
METDNKWSACLHEACQSEIHGFDPKKADHALPWPLSPQK